MTHPLRLEEALLSSLLEALMLNVTLVATGALSFAVNGTHWLDGGPTVMRQHAVWYSSDCDTLTEKCKDFTPGKSTVKAAGTDAFGEYTATSLAWEGGRRKGKGNDGARLETAVRT